MDVRVERILDEDTYEAVLDNVEEKETKFGERLMWTFRIPGEDNATVVGFTSKSYSTRAHAYQWASAIMGEIDPKKGWGPEDVIGKDCVLVVEIVQGEDGRIKNKILKVKPIA